MGAKRTLLNKQVHRVRKGPLHTARTWHPLSRARRMNTPFGTVSASRFTLAFTAVKKMMEAKAQEQAAT